MNDRELLEFIAAQVGGLTADMKEVKETVSNIDSRLSKVENHLKVFESKMDLKLSGLFDGHSATTEKLDTIDSKVDDISSTVTNIEIITSKNWNDIAILKKAK